MPVHRLRLKRSPHAGMAARLAAVLVLALALPVAAWPAEPASPAALHGGVVTQVQGVECELVATNTMIQLYLRSRTPVDLPKTRARVTLRAGIDQQEVNLKPSGDKLEAIGAFQLGPGTQVVAEIAPSGGTPMTARFVLP